MVPRGTAALALVLLAMVLAPHDCHGGFFDLLGRNKKNETATTVPPSKESDLKPTIDVSVYSPGGSVPDLKDGRRRGSARRGGGSPTQTTDVASGTLSSSLPAPAGTSETQAQVMLKSGKEPSETPEQTVLTQFITKKDNNNIVATIDVPAPQPIITGSPQITNRAGDAPPDQNHPVDGELSEDQPPNYSPFVPDPSNPRVMYGPYPSELGFKPFGFLPPFRNQPDYGFRNVMEMGPHPWWHPYGRRHRTWYDFPPRHPRGPEPVQYIPMTPLWARPRMVRDLYSLESEIFNEEDPRHTEPQGFLPYSYYNPYPYNHNYGSIYPYFPPPPPPPYAYGYPWIQPHYLPPPPPPAPSIIPYPYQEIPPETPGSVGNEKDSQGDASRPGETSVPQHHVRRHKYRQVDPPSMRNQQVPHVQQPWPRPTHHRYVGHQPPYLVYYPRAVVPPPAIQSPSVPQEPPPPPPSPPPPSGGDVPYKRVV